MGKLISKDSSENMLKLCILTLCFLLTSTQNLSRSEGCPDDPGWWSTYSSCYLASHDRMTWFEAQEFCYEKEGYLAEITSHEEETLLDSILLADIEYWIGLSDFASEGTWVWQDSHKHAEYTNWAPTEPNNGNGANEDCVVKSFVPELGKPGWNDYTCDFSAYNVGIHALCEFDKLLA